MDDTFYVISRGYEGKALTPAQRKSSLFAEEPVVMGKILRRGAAPIRLTPVEFEANKSRLKQLEAAGAIKIKAPGITDQTLLDEVDASKMSPQAVEQQKMMQEAALSQQRAESEAAALAALEADNKAKKDAEDLKAAEAAKEGEKVETPAEVAPETVPVSAQDTSAPPPPPSAPKMEKKSHSSKKGKG